MLVSHVDVRTQRMQSERDTLVVASLKDQLLGASEPKTKSFMDQISPLAGNDPAAQFVMSVMDMADRKGVLDDAFKPASVEDRADLLDEKADPLQFLNRDELVELVDKYLAIPEPQRSQIGETLKRELPPQVGQRLDAVVRFVQQEKVKQGNV